MKRALGTLVEEGQAFIDLSTRGIDRVPRVPERFDVVVIGGGQAGLSVGHFLAAQGVRFVILDAEERVGGSWRRRWDSLRLFSPARFNGLEGMPFPAPPSSFPTKDEMADYLESYAARFALPVRNGVRVDALTRRGEGFLVKAGEARYEADQVVVAMASYQRPKVPGFAPKLSPEILQVHSPDYKSPSQLRPGGVLIVGAGNSGAEIAMELAAWGHKTWMAGRDTGHIPFRHGGLVSRFVLPFLFRVIFHRLLSLATPLGRRVRSKVAHRGQPLIRVKPKELARAGVQRVPRVAGVQDGSPVLEDGRTLDVANVIWCTGYHPGFGWVELPAFNENGEPRHIRGVAEGVPGLYFVGLHFLYAMSSSMIHGVGRDAKYVAERVVARARTPAKAA